jgi:hypothetical protein
VSDYIEAWQLRLDALSSILGPADTSVLTSPVPLYLGGSADVLTFRHFVRGVTYVTGGLTGVDGVEQMANASGNYELMMCTRTDEDWAPSIISRLAAYTLEAELQRGETMDCSLFPESELAALLFCDPPKPIRFTFEGTEYGCLLCVGITARELEHCQEHGSETVLETLKSSNVFPFTDLHRS